MKKLFSFRPFLFIFLFLCLGILTAYAFLIENTGLKIVGIVVFSLLLLLFGLSFFKKRYAILNLIKPSLVVVFIVVFMFSFINTLIQVNEFEKIKLNKDTYVVEARITDDKVLEGNELTLNLENVTVIKDENVIKLKKEIRLFVTLDDLEESSFTTGSTIYFVSEIYDYSLIKNNKINTYYFTNNLGYYSGINSSDVSISLGQQNLDEMVRSRVKALLTSNLSYDNANFSYAVLFGDKSLVEEISYEYFSESGIAHILAISGLHIGFLVVAFLFLFSVIKLNKKLQFILLFIILAFYSYLCGFSPSVVRASIMALTLLFAKLLGEQNDNLSSLSFAGILILIIWPISLFTAGFLLSFTSVFGIFLLYPLLFSLFKKVKLPNVIIAPVAVTLSVQIATLPIVANLFNKINLLAVFTNIVALPIFTVGYIALFISVIFSSITAFFEFLFFVPNLLFILVHFIAKFVSHLSIFSPSLFTFPFLASILFYFCLFNLSQFNLLQKKPKIILNSVLIFVLIFVIIVGLIPVSYKYDSVMLIDNVKTASVITTSENKNYLVDIGEGKAYDEYAIVNFLNDKKIKNLEAIFLTNYNEEKQTVLSNLVEKYSVKDIFIPTTTNNVLLFNLTLLLPYNTNLEMLANEEIVIFNNLTITSFSTDGVGYLLKVRSSSMEMLFLDNAINTLELSQIKTQILPITDVIVLNKLTTTIYNELSENEYFNTIPYVLTKEKYFLLNQKNLYDTITYGHLQVKRNYDKLDLIY